MDTYCMECNFRRNLALARSMGTEEQATAFIRELMAAMVAVPAGDPSPVLGPRLTELLTEHYGLPRDRYAQDRLTANRFVAERLEDIRRRVAGAEDPLYAGLQYAILGNYLDFSALQGQVSFQDLEAMLDKAYDFKPDPEVFESFRRDLARAGTLLYLTDNAGEIGFDRIFAEEIARAYPNLSITFCVRGDIAVNDATREDAEAVGVPFPIIDNGNDVAGTVPRLMSPESRQALENADLILSKGLGNCETLYGEGYPIYYAFLVKCAKFQHLFQKPLMTPMLVKEPNCGNWK